MVRINLPCLVSAYLETASAAVQENYICKLVLKGTWLMHPLQFLHQKFLVALGQCWSPPQDVQHTISAFAMILLLDTAAAEFGQTFPQPVDDEVTASAQPTAFASCRECYMLCTEGPHPPVPAAEVSADAQHFEDAVEEALLH